MNKKKLIFTVVGAILIILTIVLLIIFIDRDNKSDTATIGFIMSGSVDEDGWNGMHYRGVRDASENYGVELLVKENVKEFTGECNEAIEDLVEEGVGMIILSSYGYSEEAMDLVTNYPEVVFYANSSEYHEQNLTSYFARMYQARYLAGVVAGMKTDSQKIGYVAAMNNNEVNRGINAFTLGVKRVNPKAEVVVAWTGEWDNAEKEKELADALIEQEQVDVLTYHQNQQNVIEVAEAAGVYSIGYHDIASGYSDKCLTSVVCNWAPVYGQIIREYLVGNANMKNNYWIGMEVDAVGLSDYSSEVTQDIQEEVEKAKAEFMAGKDVFSGTIYDNEGILRCEEQENISDEVLLEQMCWFVEGVVFYEK